jgi:hypothetical protein
MQDINSWRSSWELENAKMELAAAAVDIVLGPSDLLQCVIALGVVDVEGAAN